MKIVTFDPKKFFFSAVNFFKFLVIKALDLDPDPNFPKMPDPGPY